MAHRGGVGVVYFLSRPGRGLAGTLAVLLAFRPDSGPPQAACFLRCCSESS